MRSRFRAALCLLGLSASALACAPEPLPSGDGAATAWRVVGTWSGRGSTQTPSFEVATGALRLRWETRNEGPRGAGTFRVSLHSAISGRWLQTVADVRGVGGAAVYLEDEPRLSYLVIESANIDWTATLEEAFRASSE